MAKLTIKYGNGEYTFEKNGAERTWVCQGHPVVVNQMCLVWANGKFVGAGRDLEDACYIGIQSLKTQQREGAR